MSSYLIYPLTTRKIYNQSLIVPPRVCVGTLQMASYGMRAVVYLPSWWLVRRCTDKIRQYQARG
jgi:hypothetical protein